jgi:hypothetical protein
MPVFCVNFIRDQLYTLSGLYQTKKNTYCMKMSRITTTIFVAVMIAGGAYASPIIRVTPASAPNAFGSPSYGGWVTNAINAQIDGLSTAGIAGTPTYYEIAPAVMELSQNIVTGFASWKGQADPGTVFGPGFSSELGNRLHFGVNVIGNGQLISISDLAFSAVSTDPSNSLSFAFGAGSYNYSTQYVGILYGTDGMLGGGDDIYVTGGPNTTQVNQIVGRGSGNAWAVYAGDPGATLQDKIDLAVANLSTTAPFDFIGTYSLGSVSNSAKVTFVANVPDTTSSASLIAFALAGCIAIVRRRQMPIPIRSNRN